jgi:ketosteroid isomerase-like protein
MAATFTEHYNKQDAAGIATMFTKDAVRVSSAAPAVGPQVIEDIFKAQFRAGYNHIDLTDRHRFPIWGKQSARAQTLPTWRQVL